MILKHGKVRGRLVRVELQVQGDYRRRRPAPGDEWRHEPATTSNVTVELFSVADDELVSRQHLDLADVEQTGPVWHLQFGGNPSGDEEFENSWLSIPRWAIAPADLVLTAETLVYNLHPQEWASMQDDGEWVRLVLASEDFVMRHYVDYMSRHFQRNAADRDTTWLTAQDNRGGWNPRPDAQT